jgi:hypothetical protein
VPPRVAVCPNYRGGCNGGTLWPTAINMPNTPSTPRQQTIRLTRFMESYPTFSKSILKTLPQRSFSDTTCPISFPSDRLSVSRDSSPRTRSYRADRDEPTRTAPLMRFGSGRMPGTSQLVLAGGGRDRGDLGDVLLSDPSQLGQWKITAIERTDRLGVVAVQPLADHEDGGRAPSTIR